MNLENFLPIGTVVSLKGGTKKLMIFGILQRIENGDGNILEYDYIGVPYPEGNMGTEFQYMFNHSQIEHIYFEGFNNIERQKFIHEFSELYKEHTQK